MPLLRDGRIATDAWTFVADGDPLPGDGAVTVSFARFAAERDTLLARNSQTGVRLTPADDASVLAPWLDRLPLIEISFPKFNDGRGYSQAQLLRRRHGYAGELRAVGQVLRDQLQLMARSGFNAVQFSHSDPEAAHADAVSAFSAAYQPAADGQDSVFVRRHAGAAKEA